MDFQLTPQERESSVVSKLLAHIDQRLATLRAQNDEDVDERKTSKNRGRIAEVKAFRDLFIEKPKFASPGTTKRPDR